MATQTLEIEQKYEVPSGASLPSLEGLPQVAAVSDSKVETLSAEYYDTEDLRLLRERITLRRRAGGADEGWHLKLSDQTRQPGPTSHVELRLPLRRPGHPVPEELARLVRVHIRDARLRQVARIETRRRRTELRDALGGSLAEILTDDVTAQTFGETTTLSRWSEIEIELTGGSEELMRAADGRLRNGGLLPAGHAAKLDRALAAEPAPERVIRRLTRRSTSGEVVLAYLGEQVARLKSLDPAVRRDEPDAVHQMRVATRRLRSTLQTFPAVLPASATRQLRAELKWLGTVLGEARDIEVLTGYLRRGLASAPTEFVIGPAQARIVAHYAPREAVARAAVLQVLDSRRYFAMLDELDRLLHQPPLTAAAAEPAQALGDAVARAYQRTRRRMRRARRAPAGPARDVALHETRKAAKRARYAAEATQQVFGRSARRFASGMKTVQSLLGDHQDAVNAQKAAREIGVQAHLARENAFSFGLLYERAHRDALEYADQAIRAWKRARSW